MTFIEASPAAPYTFAASSSSAMRLRENSPQPGATSAFTVPPAATTFLNASNPPEATNGVKSWSSRPNRRSGLSVPYRSMASSKARRWNGTAMSFPRQLLKMCANRPSTSSKTSSRRDEAHFDVDLRELGLPVAPGILVAEALRDLEVPVEARHHQDLLE